MSVLIDSILFENIRGFDKCSIDLSKEKLVLIGRNNSGKSSLLLLLDMLINKIDVEALKRKENASKLIWETLQPARKTGSKPRRISLNLKLTRESEIKYYGANRKGLVRLRVGMLPANGLKLFVKLGKPKRGENKESDRKALKLLNLLQNRTNFQYIPPFRGASSVYFQKMLSEAMKGELIKGSTHTIQAGAPRGYRITNDARKNLESIAEELTTPIIEELTELLPAGMLKEALPKAEIIHDDMLNWLSENIHLRLITGDHDIDSVKAISVGSGVQSLIGVVAQQLLEGGLKRKRRYVQNIIAIDEPEAFLHPSAQRLMARAILSSGQYDMSIITTHSPIIVEEAKFTDLVICEDHKFYFPELEDDNDENIFSVLLKGRGAEAIFAKSVLMVEGAGEAYLFEELRRRISKNDKTGKCDNLFVLSVDGKGSFSKWLKFFNAINSYQQNPIKFLMLADGDGAKDIRRSLLESDYEILNNLKQDIDEIIISYDTNKVSRWKHYIRRANVKFVNNAIPAHFSNVDLEYVSLKNASDKTLRKIANAIGVPFIDRDSFIKKLGSKGIDGKKEGSKKTPWMRSHIATHLPRGEMHSDLIAILERWIAGSMSKAQAKRLLADF